METIALLIKLFIISLAALTIVHYSGIIGRLKQWLNEEFQIPYGQMRLRPLDCHVCLSFWLALLYFIAEILDVRPLNISDAIKLLVCSLAASAISHYLYKIIK